MKLVKIVCIKQTVEQMNVGDKMTFNVKKVAPTTVRAAAWEAGKKLGHKYEVHQNMKQLSVSVERKA